MLNIIKIRYPLKISKMCPQYAKGQGNESHSGTLIHGTSTVNNIPQSSLSNWLTIIEQLK